MCQVLVVDDEPQVRDLTSRALHSVRLPCHTANDGDQALMQFEAWRYDVVATDLRMPKRHGFDLTTELLDRPKPPHVVVMTGFAEQRLIRELISRGVQDIFLKPFNYDLLAMKLLSLIEKRKRGRPTARRDKEPTDTQKLTQIERGLMETTSIFADSLAGVFDFDFEIDSPPKAVNDFVARFAKLEEEAADRYPEAHDDRRETVRAACPRSVIAVPVNRRFAPVGEPFMAAIRDVSEGGIRLLHTRATSTPYLALSWQAETLPHSVIRVVMQITRCAPKSPFYDISGPYVLAD